MKVHSKLPLLLLLLTVLLINTLQQGSLSAAPLIISPGDSIPPADTLNITAFIMANDPSIGELVNQGDVEVVGVNKEGWVFGTYKVEGGLERVFIITTDTTNRPSGLYFAGTYSNVFPIGISGNKIAYNRDFGGSLVGFWREFDKETETFGQEFLAGRYADFSVATSIAGDYTGSNAYVYETRPDYNSLRDIEPLFLYNIPFFGQLNSFAYIVPDDFWRGFVKSHDSGYSRPVAFPMAQYFNRYSEINDVSSDGTAVGASMGRQAGDMEVLYPMIYNFNVDEKRWEIGYALNGEAGYLTGINAYEEMVGIYTPPGGTGEQAFFIGANCVDRETGDYKFDIIKPGQFVTTSDININSMVIGTFLYTDPEGSGIENRAYIYKNCDCQDGDFYNLDEMFNLEYPELKWKLRVGKGLNDGNYAVGMGQDSLGNWMAWRVKVPECFLCARDEAESWMRIKTYDIASKAFNDDEVTKEIRITNLEDNSYAQEVYTGNRLDSLIAGKDYLFKSDDKWLIEIDFECGGVAKTRNIEVSVFMAPVPRPTPENLDQYKNRRAIAKGTPDIPAAGALEAPRFYCPDEGFDLLIIQQFRPYSDFLLEVGPDGKDRVMQYYKENNYPLADGDPEVFSDLVVREVEMWNQQHPGQEIRYHVLTDLSLMNEKWFFTWMEKYSAVWVNFEGFDEYGYRLFKKHAESWKLFAFTNTVIATVGQHYNNYASWGVEQDFDFFIEEEKLQERNREHIYDRRISQNNYNTQYWKENHWSEKGLTASFVSPWRDLTSYKMNAAGLGSMNEAHDALTDDVQKMISYLGITPPEQSKSDYFRLFRSSSLYINSGHPLINAVFPKHKDAHYGFHPSFTYNEASLFKADKNFFNPGFDPEWVKPNSSFGYFAGLDGETILAMNGQLWGHTNNLLFDKDPFLEHSNMFRNLVDYVGQATDTNFIVSPVRQFVYHALDKPCFRTSLSPEQEANVQWYYKNKDMSDFTSLDPATFTFDPDVDWGMVEFKAVYQGKEDVVWGNVANWGIYTYTADGKRHIFNPDDPGKDQPGINLNSGKIMVIAHGWQPNAVSSRQHTIARSDEDMLEASETGKEPLINRWIEDGYTIIELQWTQISDELNVQSVEKKMWQREQGSDSPLDGWDINWKHQIKEIGILPSILGISVYSDELSPDLPPDMYFAKQIKVFLETKYEKAPLVEFRMMGHSLGSGLSLSVLNLMLTPEAPTVLSGNFSVPILQSSCVLKRIEMADAYWSVEYQQAMSERVISLVDNYDVTISNYQTTFLKDLGQAIGNACAIVWGDAAFATCTQETLLAVVKEFVFGTLRSFRIAGQFLDRNPLDAQKIVEIIFTLSERIEAVWENTLANIDLLKRISQVRLNLGWFNPFFLRRIPNPLSAHGAAWVHVLYNLHVEPYFYYSTAGLPGIPYLEAEFKGFSPYTCPEMVHKFRGLNTFQHADEASNTVTTEDDIFLFSTQIEEFLFRYDRWNGFVCPPKIDLQTAEPLIVNDLIAYPGSGNPKKDTLNNNVSIELKTGTEYEGDATKWTIAKVRKDEPKQDKWNWTIVADPKKFSVQNYYPEEWGTIDAYYDSADYNYGNWLLKAENYCYGKRPVIEDLPLEIVDWGIYNINADSKQEKYLGGELLPDEFNPYLRSLLIVNGKLEGKVTTNDREDMIVRYNAQFLPMGSRWSDQDVNLLVYHDNQFTDFTSADIVGNMMYEPLGTSIDFRTEAGTVTQNTAIPKKPSSALFTEQLGSFIKDAGYEEQGNTNELMIMLKDYAGLYLPAIRDLLEQKSLIVKLNDAYDPFEIDYPVFRILLAEPNPQDWQNGAAQQDVYEAIRYFNDSTANIVVALWLSDLDEPEMPEMPIADPAAEYNQWLKEMVPYAVTSHVKLHNGPGVPEENSRQVSEVYLNEIELLNTITFCLRPSEDDISLFNPARQVPGASVCFVTDYFRPGPRTCFETVKRMVGKTARYIYGGQVLNTDLYELTNIVGGGTDFLRQKIHLQLRYANYEDEVLINLNGDKVIIPGVEKERAGHRQNVKLD